MKKVILFFSLATYLFCGSSFKKEDIEYYYYAVTYSNNRQKIYFSNVFSANKYAKSSEIANWSKSLFTENNSDCSNSKVVVKSYSNEKTVIFSKAYEINQFNKNGYLVVNVSFPSKYTK